MTKIILNKLLLTAILTLCFNFSFASGDDFFQPPGSQTPPVPSPQPPPGHPGNYFNWGQGRDGTGYCYEFNSQGFVLNGGMPQANINCEKVSPSFANWGRANNGFGYCFQFTPYNIVMNQGHPIANQTCEKVSPSYYRWGQGVDGFTYCYQFTPTGLVMNNGQNVPNHLCY